MIYVTMDQQGIDEVSEKIKAFGYQAPKVMDRILRYSATMYAGHVRSHYLSGQELQRRTGKTARMLVAKKMRKKEHDFFVSGWPLANIFEHGSPKRKGLLRPYMTRSAQTFDFEGIFNRKLDQEIEKEAKKRGLDG